MWNGLSLSIICLCVHATGGVFLALRNGMNMCSGRVEVHHNSSWGTICSAFWDLHDANVVCRQLNCGSASRVTSGTVYGPGQGPIWLAHLRCDGTESDLDQCPALPWGVHNCQHQDDAGVECSGANPPSLTGGAGSCSGKLQVFYGSSQLPVCASDWNPAESGMVCQQLQCGAAILGNVSITAAPEDVRNGLIKVTCTGQEATFTECPMNQINGATCTDGQIVQVTCSGPFRVRLADGDNMCSGRVEFSYQSTWEAICSAGWDRQNGDVVCRELGCGEAVKVNMTDHQAESRKALLRGVSCQGTETSLHRCPSDQINTNSSAQCVPASVRCSGPVPLRLVNGTNTCSGRVEVYHHGVWGTVCDNGWDQLAAGVVCRLLNCGSALSVAGGGQYGAGTGVIWLDELNCDGSEVALGQCSTKPWGVNNCGHCQDAGVSCSGPVRVRLLNGHTVCSGRVEVYHLGSWGTVCDAGWDIREAGVVCRMLNCGTALSAHTGSYFGSGTGEIWLKGVSCLGTETALDQCKSGTPVRNRCTHQTDAGVTCSGPVPVRLVNGSDVCSGRVEVLRDGVWGTVCASGQNETVASVVCKMLNCGEGELAATGAGLYGEGSGVIGLANVTCKGSESSLFHCPSSPWGVNTCTHSQDLGINCSGPVPVRLVDGRDSCSGRLEVKHDSMWGTVCSEGWGTSEATVVCRMLGCGSVGQPGAEASLREGSGQIWLGGLKCWGNERSLEHCSANPWGSSGCNHSLDVAVNCTGPFQVRLSEGSNMCSGRVEVQHGQAGWARVCATGWDLQDGNVVCRQLGCGQAEAVGKADLSQGIDHLALTGVQCDGTEPSLSWCLTDPWRSQSCAPSQDASVTCSGPVPLRLVGGNNACSGRVEVYHQGQWGTICSGNWNKSAADVVCRVLNCDKPRQTVGLAYHTNRTSGFGLEEVTCEGDEATLGLCSTSGWGQLHCNPNQDVGVTCSALLPVRLVGGNDVCSGRVEVHRDGSWGTVCDQDWELTDAEVVCRMLNCGTAFAAEQDAYYGQGNGGIKLDKVCCKGSELTLHACIAKRPACENCTRCMDAGVTCTGPIPVRLVDGSTMCSGRVEVYRDGVWSSICSDGWDEREARVVCRMLNCGEVLLPPRVLDYGYGVGLDNMSCVGTEPFLDQCSAKPWSVKNCPQAGVTCTGSIRTWNRSSCLSDADFVQKRVGGTVGFSLSGGRLCPSDPRVIEGMKNMITTLLASIPGNRPREVKVSQKRTCWMQN